MKVGNKTNPALQNGFKNATIGYGEEVARMTLSGTVVKIFILLAVLMGGFAYSWLYIPYTSGMLMAIAIGTFIIAIITTMKPKVAQFTGIIYAAFEGLLLGTISQLFEQIYPGIVLPAIVLTFGCVIATIIIYGKAPSIADKTRKMVMIGIVSILIGSILMFVLSLFGVSMDFLASGPIAIVVALAVVVVATLTLFQDYAFIVRAAQAGAPKYMEWYGAFGFMVTLIWLYMNILRLLAVLQNSRD